MDPNGDDDFLNSRGQLVKRTKTGSNIYIAKGLGVSIYTEADTIEALKAAVIDAVHCHYEDEKRRIIRLHIVREEVIAA